MDVNARLQALQSEAQGLSPERELLLKRTLSHKDRLGEDERLFVQPLARILAEDQQLLHRLAQ